MSNKILIFSMVVAAAILITIIALSVHASSNLNTKELLLLHIVSRHGARTPADTYPNDPYVNETFFPIGWGQLTNAGKLQLYNNGQQLRERYDKFLGSHYSPDVFYTQSTDVDRTKASMQLINAGLWPPAPLQKWGPLDWQPIPVFSEPLSQDSLLLVRKPCAQYNLELDRLLKTPEIEEKLQEYRPLFKELARITGKQVNNFDDVQDIYSTLKAEESFNLTLPDWTKDFYPDKLLPPTEFSFVLNAYNTKLNRLKGGVFLKKLLADWKGKADATIKPKGRKAFLYGGHDSTVSNLLSALKVWDPQVPGYGITILLEFSRDRITNDFGVEIYLRNSTELVLHQLKIPGCDLFCPLPQLEQLTEDVIPGDWDAECASDDPDYVPPPPSGP